MVTERDDCLTCLKNKLRRTAHWRETTIKGRYSDPRNDEAATLCKGLVEQANLTDDEWLALKPHFSWTSQAWLDAIQEASRKVGFRHDIADFRSYVRFLRGLLSVEPSTAQ